MTPHDWILIGIFAFNAITAFAGFVFGLQLKVWRAEDRAQVGLLIAEHDDDPNAHPNHALSKELEKKFDDLIKELREVTQGLAVLTERIKNLQVIAPLGSIEPRRKKSY